MQKRGMWKVWVLAVTLVVLSEFLVGFSAAEGTAEVLQVPILMYHDFAAMEELFAAEETRTEGQADTVHRLMEEVFVYPFGAYSPESEATLTELGVRATVTTDIGVAEVSVGEGLTLLPRVMAEWMGK